MVVDLFLLYSFVKRLATPFEDWKAFDQGVIDKDGKILVKRKEMNDEQKRALGLFDTLILNLKRLIAKIPGGDTRIATFAAALWLLKEDESGVTEDNLEQVINRLNEEHGMLVEALQQNGNLLLEDEGGSPPSAVPTNNTTNIANKDGPILTRLKRKAIEKANNA